MIWLGLHKHKKDYLKDAPKGYQAVREGVSRFPREVISNGDSMVGLQSNKDLLSSSAFWLNPSVLFDFWGIS